MIKLSWALLAPDAPGGTGTPGEVGAGDPATGGDSGASPAAGDPAAAPAVAPGGTPAVDDPWNGEVESLRKEAWWNELPEDRRGRVEAGLKAKHSNWQKGFQPKLDAALAETRKHKEELERATARNNFFDELLAQDDAAAGLSKELDGLRKSLGEKDAVLAARDTEVTTLKGKLAELEARESDRHTAAELSRLEAEYPDIYADFVELSDEDLAAGKENTGAFVDFARLVKAGIPEARAATMVRADMAARPRDTPAAPARDKTLPPSIKAMSRGGPSPSTTTRNPNESYEDVRARLLAEAKASGDDED